MNEPSATVPNIAPPAAPQPLARRTLRWVDVALVLVGFLALELILAPGFARAVHRIANEAGPGMDSYPLPVLIQLVTQEGLILLAIFCLAALRGVSLDDLGFRKTPFFWLLAGIGLLAVVLPLRLCAGLAAHFALGGTWENIGGVMDENTFPVIASPALAGLPTVFMIGVVAPLVEELIFRAILYAKLRERLGAWWATIISSLFFGLIHPFVAMGVSAVVMGIALAWLYEKSRSLWIPFVLHALNNSALFLFLVFVLGMQELMRLPVY